MNGLRGRRERVQAPLELEREPRVRLELLLGAGGGGRAGGGAQASEASPSSVGRGVAVDKGGKGELTCWLSAARGGGTHTEGPGGVKASPPQLLSASLCDLGFSLPPPPLQEWAV